MRHSSDTIIPNGAPEERLQVSQDGYVRMSLSFFMKLPLVHFLSGLDGEPFCETIEGGTKASISGYSEWLSATIPKITVGWDWRLDLATGTPQYVRDGWPRSNIMLIDAINGRDLGEETTATNIAIRIDQAGWCNDIGKYIAMLYS